MIKFAIQNSNSFFNFDKQKRYQVTFLLELQHIDEEIARLGHKSAKELSVFSHQDIPWISTEIGKNIPYEAVFYRTKETSVRNYAKN